MNSLFDNQPSIPLHEWAPNDTGDCFVMLEKKAVGSTRDGKPYYRVTFRDKLRSVQSMIWQDAPLFSDCEDHWTEGAFYKIRGRYYENQYGPQFELEKLRTVNESDKAEGFDEADFVPASRFDREGMFGELRQIAETEITDSGLSQLVESFLNEFSEEIQNYPAASRNHHAFVGGYLEHVLSVTKNAVFFAGKYSQMYPEMAPPLNTSLVVAGAILHDIGKLQELMPKPQGAIYTPSGQLIGHILLGRDMVRERAREIPALDSETLLRLEHIIVSHQNLPEWGSPVAPHTPEALLVHYADDTDAKYQMMVQALTQSAASQEPFTSRDNPMRRSIFRGFPEEPTS